MGGRSDHIDGDGLNNRRANLRLASQAQNGLNRSAKAGKRFKGVYQHKSGRFYAQCAIGGEVFSSPSFVDIETAALAYDAMARRLHGSWARLNLPDQNRTFRFLDAADGRQEELTFSGATT
mgnify:FL=1